MQLPSTALDAFEGSVRRLPKLSAAAFHSARLCLGLLLTGSALVFGQGPEWHFSAADEARLGETLRGELRFVPAVDGPIDLASLALGRIPSSSDYSLSLGEATAPPEGGTVRWPARLRLLNEGALALPGATLFVDGTALRGDPLRLEVGRADKADEHATLTVITPQNPPRAGEAFTLGVRFRWRSEAADFSLVPLLAREMEVPVSLHAPWLAVAPLGLQGPLDVASREGPQLALGDRLWVVEEEATAEPGWRSVVASSRFRAEEAGTLRLARPFLTLAFATQFRDSFVQGRVPTDRREAVLSAPAPVFEVLPAASESPSEASAGKRFAGSAGASASLPTLRGPVQLSLRLAEHRIRQVPATLELIATLSGPGAQTARGLDLAAGVPGFRSRGVLTQEGDDGAIILRHDLVLLDASVTEWPARSYPLSFPTSSPERANEPTTLDTPALQLTRDEAALAAAEAQRDQPPKPSDTGALPGEEGVRWGPALLGFAVALILGTIVLARRRRPAR